MNNTNYFGPALVKRMLGGEFPESNGFDWSCVTVFKLEDGLLHPYGNGELLPGPSFKLELTIVGLQ